MLMFVLLLMTQPIMRMGLKMMMRKRRRKAKRKRVEMMGSSCFEPIQPVLSPKSETLRRKRRRGGKMD